MLVVPGLIGHIDFDVESAISSRCSGVMKRRRVRIDIDPLAAGDLDQALPRQVGMIIDLRIRRRDQDALLMVTDTRSRNLGCDFLEHAIEHFAVAAIDRADIAHVEPKPAARDRVDHLTAAEIADFALAPDAARSAAPVWTRL